MAMLHREASFSFSQLSHKLNTTSPAGTPPKKVAMLTAGGLAPCLSSAVGALIKQYDAKYPDVEIICYINGYKGLLLGDSIPVTADIRQYADWLHSHGGSPIGNSRVKLTNVKDCVKRGEWQATHAWLLDPRVPLTRVYGRSLSDGCLLTSHFLRVSAVLTLALEARSHRPRQGGPGPTARRGRPTNQGRRRDPAHYRWR